MFNINWTPLKHQSSLFIKYFHNRCQNITQSTKISNPARLYIFPKNVLPSSADEKRLSSSRNSTTLPPPSLSTVNFTVHRLTTHATHRFADTRPRRIHFTFPTCPMFNVLIQLPNDNFGWGLCFYTSPF